MRTEVCWLLIVGLSNAADEQRSNVRKKSAIY